MAYTLSIRDDPTARTLCLTVWEMSVLRDRMIAVGAAHVEFPPPASSQTLDRRCPSGLRGIPAYKLSDPCGWLVRPDEIREALSLIEDDDGTNDLWTRWIDFLSYAEAAGGFKVG